ncbi:hypothetical protein [Bosea sp. (in: a-proteobacteria)]|uniref:hypothetical protein n=1 Tax=Bosea sp. (in: a-proteobacteria) TaxID=1871050 RepID=UPI002733C87E|nr:hypothetical protein [Bosea sp. (in: a-proteobacteria)]MDP3258386.1 hypothetical protein [Bosea sp. (in: a-proteobacteria)]
MADPGAFAASAAPVFCAESELGYRRSLTDFADGPLTLDEPYRLAHLPLVAPDHPRVIARQEGRSYEMGVHPPVYSLVLPVDGALLAGSEPFQRLDNEIRAAPFAPKIAWGILPRRAQRLHATLCGTLSTGDAPVISDETREALARIEPFAVDLRGPFSGNVNRGRIYLRAYPEKRGERNPIHAIQAAFGRPPGDLYLVGLYNLTDDLDTGETAALAEIIARWWDVSLLRFTVTDLWLLGASDDLVLDSQISETLPLGTAGRLSPKLPARP